MLDLLIKNGLIIDGTGKAGYQGDVGVKDGNIMWIREAHDGKSAEAEEYINAQGLIVCPGFIDVHSHNDLVPYMSEELQQLKLYQGVTTELVGQCGLGVVPCSIKDMLWKNYIQGVVGNPALVWGFGSMDDYLKALDTLGTENNVAALISHGAVRARVMGFEKEEATNSQIASMCQLVEDAMIAGAIGMSLGLQYMPGIFSGRDELSRLCACVKQHEGIVMVHLRNHDSSIVEALQEIISIADRTGVKLHISHLRSYKSNSLGCSAAVLIDIVDNAILKGIDITFDEHLYLSGSTLLTQLLPPWVVAGGPLSMSENLKSPLVLDRIRAELENHQLHYKGWDNYYGVTGWHRVLITSVKRQENKEYIGKTIAELAQSDKMDPLEFVAQLLISEGGGVGIVTREVFSEEDTIELIRHKKQMVGSDSIPAGTPHPRLYGNYPLFIGKFVREKKVLTLEEAINKCTQMPAQRLGLVDIGELAAGKIADITIFDYNEINGYEDYENPRTRPVGIRQVILNGQIALDQGIALEKRIGRVIRAKTAD